MSIQDFHTQLSPQSQRNDLASYRTLGTTRAITLKRQSVRLSWEPWPEV